MALILTEWDEIKEYQLTKYGELMKEPIIFDGRNCYNLDEVNNCDIEYYSIGRPSIIKELISK